MKQKNSKDLEALCEQLDRATDSLRDLRNLIKHTNGEYRDLHTYALEKRTLHEQEEMYAFIEALSEGLSLFDKRYRGCGIGSYVLEKVILQCYEEYLIA